MQSNAMYSGTPSISFSALRLFSVVHGRGRALAEEGKKRGLFLWPPLPSIATIRQTDIQLTRQLSIDRSLVTLLCCTEKLRRVGTRGGREVPWQNKGACERRSPEIGVPNYARQKFMNETGE